MKMNGPALNSSYVGKYRRLGTDLRVFARKLKQSGEGLPAMGRNDGWSAREDERHWQEYGDGGDCWWVGCR